MPRAKKQLRRTVHVNDCFNTMPAPLCTVMGAKSGCSGESGVPKEGPQRADGMLHIRGECHGVTPQSRDALPQRSMELLAGGGFADVLGEGFGLTSRNHASIGFIVVGRAWHPLTGHRQHMSL
jgi:hypothetical protein